MRAAVKLRARAVHRESARDAIRRGHEWSKTKGRDARLKDEHVTLPSTFTSSVACKS